MSALEDARDALEYRNVDRNEELEVLDAALRALIAEHERLIAPPTDDDREALAEVIRAATENGSDRTTEYADAILAAGYRRRGPITDEMVEAADRAWDEHAGNRLASMRAALEAADRQREGTR